MTGSGLLGWRVAVAGIAPAGEEVAFAAAPRERATLAKENGLVEVKALCLTARLDRDAKGGVTVEGRLTAEIVQSCVVTLAPVAQSIDEPVSVRFVAAGSPELPASAKPGAEIVIHADEPDPPEILDGPWLDLGALAQEHFVLAIDPYPRAPGATLGPEAVAPEGDDDSPFAALTALAGKAPARR